MSAEELLPVTALAAWVIAPFFGLLLERLDRWSDQRDWRRRAEEPRRRAPWLH